MTPADIRALRGRYDLTQEQLASKLGVSRDHIHRVEAGKTELSELMRRALRDLARELEKGD